MKTFYINDSRESIEKEEDNKSFEISFYIHTIHIMEFHLVEFDAGQTVYKLPAVNSL